MDTDAVTTGLVITEVTVGAAAAAACDVGTATLDVDVTSAVKFELATRALSELGWNVSSGFLCV